MSVVSVRGALLLALLTTPTVAGSAPTGPAAAKAAPAPAGSAAPKVVKKPGDKKATPTTASATAAESTAKGPKGPTPLKPNCRYIINPGSVGQPRDGDPRAAYALLDTTELTWSPYRIEYNIKQTQDKMRVLKIPSRLIDRLEYGR